MTIRLSSKQSLEDHITHIKYLTGMLERLMLIDNWKEFDNEKLCEAKTLTDNIILNADVIGANFDNCFDRIEELQLKV